MKGMKCCWQALLMTTVMLVVSPEALKSGNCERIVWCAQTVTSTPSGVSSSSLVSLWTRIRKSQPSPLSSILPRSSDRLLLWSSECAGSVAATVVSAITNNGNNRFYRLDIR